jgi:glycosyltransferase involved in cell wall biosynthesis
MTTSSISSRVCLLIPTYNHGKFLPGVLTKALALPWPVLVADDGSTDETPQLLEKFPEVQVVRLPVNRGKGAALAAGLSRAAQLGFELAVVLDADGQHDPADAPRLLEAANGRLDTLVIGAREDGQQAAPLGTRFGRAFSNFWIWIEAGLRVSDAQSGFRVYPVALANCLKMRSRRYGWETEMLVRLSWGGARVTEVPISISYAAKPASHFRPFQDFFLNSCVNAFLVCRRLWPWPFVRLVPEEKIVWPKSWLARLRFAWERYLWIPGQTPLQAALSIGFGAFMGIFPVWGFQMILAAFVAQRMHLNTALVLLAANISLPPVIPFIVYSALVLGRFLSSGEWVWSLEWRHLTLAMAQARAWEFVLGSVVLATVAGLVLGGASFVVLTWFKSKS